MSMGGYFRASVRRELDLPPRWAQRRAKRCQRPPIELPDPAAPEAYGALDWPDAPLPDEFDMAGRRAEENPAPANAEGAGYAPLGNDVAGERSTSQSQGARRTGPGVLTPAISKPGPAKVKVVDQDLIGLPNEVIKQLRGPIRARAIEVRDKIAEPERQTADTGGGREARAPEGTSRSGPAVMGKPANARERHKPQPIDLSAAQSAMDSRFEQVRQRRAQDVASGLSLTGMALCKCGAGRIGYSHEGPVPKWFGRDCIEAHCPLRKAA